jgi:hypothetical protein
LAASASLKLGPVLAHILFVLPLLCCRQQDFLVTVPQPSNYTFTVQPTKTLDSKGQTLHSSYGNLGSYQMMVAWPQK